LKLCVDKISGLNVNSSIGFQGGVGFDINCGVRLIRTNLHEKQVQPKKELITQSLFNHIPVGVGSKGIIPMNAKDLVLSPSENNFEIVDYTFKSVCRTKL